MTCSVYAMITELAGGARYVKFGYATEPMVRLGQVQTGCPLRIEVMLTVECPNTAIAAIVEGSLHLEHNETRSSGEWFRWSTGRRAEPEAREALLMVSQRELGRAEVRRTEMCKPPRRFASAGGYAPVIGAGAGGVEISVKRRKSLIRNG